MAGSIAGATELESMVVRLMGDGSQFMTMMKQAVDASQNAGKAVEASTRSIDNMKTHLSSLGSSARGVFGQLQAGFATVGASIGSISILKSSFKEFGDAEDNVIKLTAALKANGREVDKTLKEYMEFADGLEDTTRMGKQDALELFRVAESMGLTGDAAKRAAQNAVALSATSARGMSPKAAIRMTAGLEQGRVTMLTREFPILSTIKDKTEQVAKAQELLAKGFDVARASAQSAQGKIEQMQNAISRMKETIGQVVADFIAPFVDGIKEMAARFEQADPAIKKFLVAALVIGAAIGPIVLLFGALSASVTAIVAALGALSPLWIALGATMAAITATVVDFSNGWEGAWQSVQKFFFKTAGFLENIRENWSKLVEWIGENWDKLFINMWGALGKFMVNMTENFLATTNTFQELWDHWLGWIIEVTTPIFMEKFPTLVSDGLGLAVDALSAWAKEWGNIMLSVASGNYGALAGIKAGKDFAKEWQANALNVKFAPRSLETAAQQSGDILKKGIGKIKNPLEGVGKRIMEGLTAPEFNFSSTLEKWMTGEYRKATLNTLPAAQRLGQEVTKATNFFGDNAAVRRGSAEFRKSVAETVNFLDSQAAKEKAKAAQRNGGGIAGAIGNEAEVKDFPAEEFGGEVANNTGKAATTLDAIANILSQILEKDASGVPLIQTGIV